MSVPEKQSWFRSWFNTSYYHKLYAHRDENEAEYFISNLVNKLAIAPGSKLLDLACGRGRHSFFLSEMGFDVTGIDLSEKNIAFARQVENECLHFEVGDMRLDFGCNRFDYIFNLFTSFGYFNDRQDNLNTLSSIDRALNKDGILVLDFMNVNKVRLGLVKEEVREQEGIEFHIERSIRDDMVIKSIRFIDKGREYHFEEKVQLLLLSDFQSLFREVGLTIDNIYGDFNLSPFDFRNSERLILFARSKSC